MRVGMLAGSLLAAMAAAGLAHAASDPRDVAEKFCKARLADDEAGTLALVTPSLRREIEAAKVRSDVIAKATPDEKPPLGDGIPYQAFPDVPGTCAVGETVRTPGRVEIEVVYGFPGAANAAWKDRLKIVAEGDDLLVDDVVYANVANGEPDQSLRLVLFSAFDN